MSAHQSTYSQPAWLQAFRDGRTSAIEACYREYFDVVDAAVGSVLSGADRDTVVHEVFYKLLTRPDVRNSFSGTSLSNWLRATAKNHAVDFARRRRRELVDSGAVAEAVEDEAASPEGVVGAKQIIERFRERLPSKLQPVFLKRFIEQRTQREAAKALGMPRTSLVYHELLIRRCMHRFIAEAEP